MKIGHRNDDSEYDSAKRGRKNGSRLRQLVKSRLFSRRMDRFPAPRLGQYSIQKIEREFAREDPFQFEPWLSKDRRLSLFG